jgi:hypothetical protein
VTPRLTPEEAAAAVASATPIPSGRPAARPVRTSFEGEDLDGRPVRVALDEPTLVVLLSTTCDGCRDLAELVRSGSPHLAVLGVLRAPVGGLPDAATTAFAGSAGRWVLGDDAFVALDVVSAPYFCLIDVRGSCVVEGVAFGRSHVEAHVVRALEGHPRPDAVRLRPENT